MNLVYTDTNRKDVGIIVGAEFECESGDDGNLITLKRDFSDPKIEPGALVYIDETGIGGTVDGYSIDTSKDSDQVTYTGRSFTGILAKKVIQPPSGSTHLVCSGDANDVIAKVIENIGAKDVFATPGVASGISVASYRFNRYCTAYEGLRAMLASVGAKLCLLYDGDAKRVIAHAEPIADLGESMFDTDVQPDIQLSKSTRRTNHLICLGKGEGTDRTVFHWYADKDGAVSTKQTLFGIDEIAEVYDSSSAELDELKEDGQKKLLEYQEADSVEVSIGQASSDLDVGDEINAYEPNFGVKATAKVLQRTFKMTATDTDTDYSAGDVRQAGI